MKESKSRSKMKKMFRRLRNNNKLKLDDHIWPMIKYYLRDWGPVCWLSETRLQSRVSSPCLFLIKFCKLSPRQKEYLPVHVLPTHIDSGHTGLSRRLLNTDYNAMFSGWDQPRSVCSLQTTPLRRAWQPLL